jgi:putative flippase GtrA
MNILVDDKTASGALFTDVSARRILTVDGQSSVPPPPPDTPLTKTVQKYKPFQIIPAVVLEFFKYGVVGAAAAITNIGTLVLFKEVFAVYYLVSNTAGFFTGLTVNYFLSKSFVFTEKFKFNKFREFSCYFLISIIGLGFDSALIWVLTEKAGLYYLASKIISTVIVFWWNFLSKKYINMSPVFSAAENGGRRPERNGYREP